MKLRDGVVAVVLVCASTGWAQAQPSEPAEPPPPGTETPPELPAEPAPGVEGEPELPAPLEEPTGEASATAEGEVAAEAEVAAEQPTSSGEDDIIVTGSRLRSRTFGSAVPVEVIDSKALEKAGAKNLADVVQYLVGTQGTGPQGNTVTGLAGSTATAVNLRGLGTGATLVLVNGRRLNPSGAALNATFADMSVIPIAAVERLEVLKAGASAIYGADAVGGVINVITRRNWDGAKLQFDGQTTSRWDHQEYTVSASVGTTSERGRMLAAMSYFRRTMLMANERAFPPDKFVSLPAVWPPAYLSFMEMGRPTYRDDICMQVPGFCNGSYAQYIYLLPNSERANAFANAEYDLTPHVTMLAELTVSRFRGDAVSLPSFSVTSKQQIIPANHIDNKFGAPLALLGAPIGAPQGAERQTSADDTFRAVLGVKGDLGASPVLENWQWELSTSYGISRYRESVGDNLVDALQLAINSCSDPENLSNCFNPFYSAYDGTGTPNTTSVIQRFRSRQVLQADHALQTYNLGVDGEIFKLPGGMVGLAVGGEIRKEWRVLEFDHDATQLRFGFLFGNTNQTARRSVYGGYLELRWPFFNGVELRTAARVERYTDTDDSSVSPFAAFTLSIGDMIGRDRAPTLLQRLQFRGAASRAFRAPTISNTYPGYGTLPAPLQYEMVKGSGVTASQYTRVRYFGNPELKPETAITFSGGLTWTPIDEIFLSGDYWYYDYRDRIQAENAQSALTKFQREGEVATDGKVEIDPATRQLLGVNVKYMNLPTSIRTSGLDFGITLRVDGSTFGRARDAFGQISLGVDGTYTRNFMVPRSEAGDMYATKCLGDGPTDYCNVAGFRNAYIDAVALPELRMNLPLSWAFGNEKVTHSVSLIGHYISSFADDAARPMPGMAPNYPDIPAWFSFDLGYSLNLKQLVGEAISVRLGCQNVTDEMPPVVAGMATYYVGEVHDPRGRMLYGSLSAEF